MWEQHSNVGRRYCCYLRGKEIFRGETAIGAEEVAQRFVYRPEIWSIPNQIVGNNEAKNGNVGIQDEGLVIHRGQSVIGMMFFNWVLDGCNRARFLASHPVIMVRPVVRDSIWFLWEQSTIISKAVDGIVGDGKQIVGVDEEQSGSQDCSLRDS